MTGTTSTTRYVSRAKRVNGELKWGVYDLELQEWAIRFRDGTMFGGISLTPTQADLAAARLEEEKNDVGGVEPVMPTDDFELS